MYKTIAALLIVILFQTAAFAQAVAGFGGVSGVVRDSTGAIVVNAKVEVVNESKGIKRTLTTNEAGVFNAPALVPAAGYQVTERLEKAEPGHPDERIIAAVERTNADLLVMGAYGHSRLREFVFGGVTRHIARHMTVPTLFSH